MHAELTLGGLVGERRADDRLVLGDVWAVFGMGVCGEKMWDGANELAFEGEYSWGRKISPVSQKKFSWQRKYSDSQSKFFSVRRA